MARAYASDGVTRKAGDPRSAAWLLAAIVLISVTILDVPNTVADGGAENLARGGSAVTEALGPPKSLLAPPATYARISPPGVIDHGDRSIHAVALTFDSNLTAEMLGELRHHRVASFDNHAVIDELDALQVPATFFLSGLWMEQYPDETRRLAADPLFELGSHSFAHIGFAPRCYHLGLLPVQKMAADVRKSEEILDQFTPHPTTYFRFPGGCYNATALAAVRGAAVTVIGFDVASGDAFGRSVAAIVRTTLSSARNGSIVVMHITGGNTAPLTAMALPAIVTGLRARGFRLVRVSDLLAAGAAGDGLPGA